MNPRILLSAAALAASLPATLPAAGPPPPNEGVLTLVDEPGYNKIDITLSVALFGSDTDTSTFTGTMQARLDIDPATGLSPEFTLLGGDVEGSPIALSVGNFFGSINVTSSTLGGTVVTISPPGTIDPATGTGDAAQHEFTINRGTVSGTALGNPINIDFSTDPTGGPGKGTESVVITPTGTDATRAYFQVTFILPVQFEEPIPNDYGANATISGSGTFKATGQVSVPLSDYLFWTEQQGIAGADPSEPAQSGAIDLGLLWALGLGIDDNPLPHLLRPDAARPRGFLLTPPAGGTAAPLFIEASSTLAPGSWTLIDPSELSLPANPLPANPLPANPLPVGTSETVAIAPSTLPARYIRIRAQP